MLRSIYRFLRRAHIVDVTRLMHWECSDLEPRPLAAKYIMRMLSVEELTRMRETGAAPMAIGHPSELTRGERVCLAILDRDRVVSHLWIGCGRVEANDNFSRSQHLGTSIELPHATGFIFNAWTAPAHRGQGLIAAMLEFAVNQRLLGANALLTTMDWTNEPSRRAFAKLGMRSMGLIWRFGWGRLQFSCLPSVPALLGLRIGSDAPGWVIRNA